MRVVLAHIEISHGIIIILIYQVSRTVSSSEIGNTRFHMQVARSTAEAMSAQVRDIALFLYAGMVVCPDKVMALDLLALPVHSLVRVPILLAGVNAWTFRNEA